MDYSTPGFPVLHCLPKFAQIHVYWTDDTIQAPHALPPTSKRQEPHHTTLKLVYFPLHYKSCGLQRTTSLNKSCFLKEKRKEKSHRTDKGNRRCNRKSIGIQLAPWPRSTEPMSSTGWWPAYGENEYYIVHTHLNQGRKEAQGEQGAGIWGAFLCTYTPRVLHPPSETHSRRPGPTPPGENWSLEEF